MATLFHTWVYQPILSLLIFFYERLAWHDLGIAIILLTIALRIVLFPIFYKGAHHQSLMTALQPKIKKIQTDHKDNKETQAKALMALYKEHKLNPLSGLFLILLQLPIFIALFQVFSKELTNEIFQNHIFLGFINLTEANIALAICAAALQYVQGKLSLPRGTQEEPSQNPLAQASKMMVYFAPGLTLIVLLNLPAALGIYWAVSTPFSIGQQMYINKKLEQKMSLSPLPPSK